MISNIFWKLKKKKKNGEKFLKVRASLIKNNFFHKYLKKIGVDLFAYYYFY